MQTLCMDYMHSYFDRIQSKIKPVCKDLEDFFKKFCFFRFYLLCRIIG